MNIEFGANLPMKQFFSANAILPIIHCAVNTFSFEMASILKMFYLHVLYSEIGFVRVKIESLKRITMAHQERI